MDLNYKDIELDIRPLHERFRPTEFDQVIGQDEVVKSMKAQIAAVDRPHSYIIVGPTGCGKTTLARIMAKKIGANDFGIVQFNAPNEGKIDNVRDLIANSTAMSIGSDYKVIIIDEIHSFSKEAWAALLEPTEEPESHVYWFLLTTEEPKIPPANRTRLVPYKLNPVSDSILKPYVAAIARQTGITLAQGSLDVIVEGANGSVRQALINLQSARAATSAAEAKKVLYNLQIQGEDSGAERLGKLMMKGTKDWGAYKNVLYAVMKETPSSVRSSLMLMTSRKIQDGQNIDEIRLYLIMLDCIRSLPETQAAYEFLPNLQMMVGKFILSIQNR